MKATKRTLASKCLSLSALGVLCAGIAGATTINLSTGTATYTITSDTISQAPDSGYTGTAITITSLPPSPYTHAGSVSNGTDTTSTWVGPNAAQANETGTVSGDVTYQVQFNLTGFNLATANLIISLAADDFAGSITLNGNTIFTPSGTQISNGMWGAGVNVPTVTNTAFFNAGLNTITFVVDNHSGDGANSCCGPVGLIAAVDVTATPSGVPEPGTIGITGIGLVGLAVMLHRRRNLSR